MVTNSCSAQITASAAQQPYYNYQTIVKSNTDLSWALEKILDFKSYLLRYT